MFGKGRIKKMKTWEPKPWYEIIKILPFDFEPIIWFTLSASLIFSGVHIITVGKETAVGTLFVALGGAGITRVRGTRKPKDDKSLEDIKKLLMEALKKGEN